MESSHNCQLRKLLAQKLGRLPVRGDLRVKAHAEPGFPSYRAFYRLGAKPELIKRLATYCETNGQFQDVVKMCGQYIPRVRNEDVDISPTPLIGFVSLVKAGRFFKIGKTNSAGRRDYELAIQLPEKANQVHVIETDDPTGVEAYWHKRFQDKRKNGEWFELSPADVAAFKKWGRIAWSEEAVHLSALFPVTRAWRRIEQTA